jgi:hypothetical protein
MFFQANKFTNINSILDDLFKCPDSNKYTMNGLNRPLKKGMLPPARTFVQVFRLLHSL